MTKDEIIKICKEYKIENYKINDDMSIDVDGHVYLMTDSLSELPLSFSKVSGQFNCYWNGLTTLKGCPNYVGGNFSCHFNKLTTLNDLPMNFYIGGDFYCNSNSIKTPIEYSRLFFGTIGDKILTGYNNLNIFLNEHKNPPKKDLPIILSELRKLQFEY